MYIVGATTPKKCWRALSPPYTHVTLQQNDGRVRTGGGLRWGLATRASYNSERETALSFFYFGSATKRAAEPHSRREREVEKGEVLVRSNADISKVRICSYSTDIIFNIIRTIVDNN